MYFIFCSFGENKFIMVNWQFYGEDKKQNTPPQSPLPPKQERSKFKWTGIPIVILIGVGMMKFIGGEMKNKPTNSGIQTPILHNPPSNFVPTNNITYTPPIPIPEINNGQVNRFQITQENILRYTQENILRSGENSNSITTFNEAEKALIESFSRQNDNIILSTENDKIILSTPKFSPPDKNKDESFNIKIQNIDIIPKNSILNQQNSFDSKTKINGSLD